MIETILVIDEDGNEYPMVLFVDNNMDKLDREIFITEQSTLFASNEGFSFESWEYAK